MYQQQSQPEPLLPHESVHPGCVISSIAGLILLWLWNTIIASFTGDIWQCLLVTVIWIVLIILIIKWHIYATKRQREGQAAWYTWQLQRQAYEAYQRQQWQRYYAYQEEQRCRQEEQQRKERLAMVKTLGDLLVLSASEFEQRVADLFVLVGYSNVQTTGGSGDLMADIKCTSPRGDKVVVQCKRYVRDHNVGSPEIQKFAGMMHAYHKAGKGIFITTSSFTEPAIELGRALHVELIDGEMLCQYFLRVGQASTT